MAPKKNVKEMIDKYQPKTGLKISKELEAKKTKSQEVFSTDKIVYTIKGEQNYLAFVYNDILNRICESNKDLEIVVIKNGTSDDDYLIAIVDKTRYPDNNTANTIYEYPIITRDFPMDNLLNISFHFRKDFIENKDVELIQQVDDLFESYCAKDFMKNKFKDVNVVLKKMSKKQTWETK